MNQDKNSQKYAFLLDFFSNSSGLLKNVLIMELLDSIFGLDRQIFASFYQLPIIKHSLQQF